MYLQLFGVGIDKTDMRYQSEHTFKQYAKIPASCFAIAIRKACHHKAEVGERTSNAVCAHPRSRRKKRAHRKSTRPVSFDLRLCHVVALLECFHQVRRNKCCVSELFF